MTYPAWFPDELAHAGPEHLDPGYVATYTRKSGFDAAEDIAELQALGLDDTSTLVDLGAGTGIIALAAAAIARRVVAVDVSPAMLAVLRDSARGLGNVDIVQAGLLSYEHTEEPADFVYSRHVLHHLTDFWKAIALRRIAGMLKPGGVFYLKDLTLSCEIDEVGAVVEPWLAGAARRPEDGWTRAELETHLREEHSTFSWLLEPMLEHSGFAIQRAEHRASRLYSTYVCIRR